MRFFYGLLLGFAATGINFIILYTVVRWLIRGQSGAPRYVAPLAQIVRYGIFGAIVFLTIRFRIGSPWGLLAGVTIGIAGFLTWQLVYNARYRRSS